MRLKRMALLLLVLLALPAHSSLADNHTGAPGNFRGAQFVWIALGAVNTQQGIALMTGPWDGLTEPVPDGNARKTAINPAPRPTPTDPEQRPGTERYFYFDVHDTYIRGGINKVVLTITYLDLGLTPLWLDYDSFDINRPDGADRSLTHKRIPLGTRQNTESWITRRVEIEDARYENRLDGADFRIGSDTDLVLRNVAIALVHHEKPRPPIRVFLGGQEIPFDVVPFIDPVTNRTLVPMRRIFEALGASVHWDGETRTVTALRGNTTIDLTIDNPWAKVNGLIVILDQPARIVSDRTVVPLRFVSEQLGLQVDWDDATRTIRLTENTPASP
jgi:hypothetical protein